MSILDRTIWAPDALPLVQRRFRPIYRILLPIVDFLAGMFSVIAVVIGSEAVGENTPLWFGYGWGVAVGVSAVAAFVGLVFQNDWVEILGKLGLVVSLAVYIALLAMFVGFGTLNTLLTVVITAGFLLFPLFRIFDLIGEIAAKPRRR